MKVILQGNLKLQLYPYHNNVQFHYKEAFLLGEETKMVVDLSWVFAKCSVIH